MRAGGCCCCCHCSRSACRKVSDAAAAHEVFAHKNRVLDRHCEDVGRDPGTVARTMLLGEAALDHVEDFVEAGADHLILMSGPPFDMEPVQRLLDAAG